MTVPSETVRLFDTRNSSRKAVSLSRLTRPFTSTYSKHLDLLIITIITTLCSHDELGTCGTGLVFPEQSVLRISVRSTNPTLLTIMQCNIIAQHYPNACQESVENVPNWVRWNDPPHAMLL